MFFHMNEIIIFLFEQSTIEPQKFTNLLLRFENFILKNAVSHNHRPNGKSELHLQVLVFLKGIEVSLSLSNYNMENLHVFSHE
jgi:hypothetical protein